MTATRQVCGEANDDHASGFGVVPRYLRGRLTAYEIAVYVALSWRADANGRCWLRHKRLAAEAGCSVSSAQRALRSLREKGLVTWEPRQGNDGGVECNTYTILVWATDDGNVIRSRQMDRYPRSHRPAPRVSQTDRSRTPEVDTLNGAAGAAPAGPVARSDADRLDAIEGRVGGWQHSESTKAAAMLHHGYADAAVVNAILAER